MNAQFRKYLNRLVLAFGCLVVLVAATYGWRYCRHRQFLDQVELRPPWMDLKTLGDNPEFVAYISDLNKAYVLGLPPDVMAACFCFKKKAGRRRTEEWDKMGKHIRARAMGGCPLTESQLRTTLGEPDYVEKASNELRYDLITFGCAGGNYVKIKIEDGKAVLVKPWTWIQ